MMLNLLGMAGLAAGTTALEHFLGSRDRKRAARRKEAQDAKDRLIQSLSSKQQMGPAAVEPARQGSLATGIAGEFNQHVADPLLAAIMPELLGKIPGATGALFRK